jgi:hypothetical protein
MLLPTIVHVLGCFNPKYWDFQDLPFYWLQIQDLLPQLYNDQCADKFDDKWSKCRNTDLLPQHYNDERSMCKKGVTRSRSPKEAGKVMKVPGKLGLKVRFHVRRGVPRTITRLSKLPSPRSPATTSPLRVCLLPHAHLLCPASRPNPPMAWPQQEAIDTFIGITGADEAVAVRKLEVPPNSPRPLPPIPLLDSSARPPNLAQSARPRRWIRLRRVRIAQC